MQSYDALMEQKREMMFASNGTFLKTWIMLACRLRHSRWNVSEALEWTSIQCIIQDKPDRYPLAKLTHTTATNGSG